MSWYRLVPVGKRCHGLFSKDWGFHVVCLMDSDFGFVNWCLFASLGGRGRTWLYHTSGLVVGCSTTHMQLHTIVGS